MRTPIKSLLALALTFAAGCAVGVLVRDARPEWFRFRHQPPVERAVRRVADLLDLSPAQQEEIRAVFQRLHPEFERELQRARAFRNAFLLRHFQEMEPLLDDRQKAVARDFLDKHLKNALPPAPPPEGPAR